MAVVINIVGNYDDKELARAQSRLASLGSSTQATSTKYGGAMGRMKASTIALGAAMGTAVVAGAVAMGRAIKDQIGASITAASDLAEVTSKVSVLFGEQASEIEKWAGTAATGMGQSRTQAMDAAATFATFGKSAGLAGRDLTKFAKENVALASDLASFSNTSPEDAITAIGAALRGESEPIRRYGVLLDDATLKAEAMRLGILKGTKNSAEIASAQIAAEKAQLAYNDAVASSGKESLAARSAAASLGSAQDRLKKATEGVIGTLTPQQKVLAAQSQIMKQTTAAQGDFARTSGGLANQQRILAAQMENLRATIGQALLPYVTKLTQWATTKLLPALQKWGTIVARELGPTMERLGAILSATIVPALQLVGRFASANAGLLTRLAAAVTAGIVVWGIYKGITTAVAAVQTAYLAKKQALIFWTYSERAATLKNIAAKTAQVAAYVALEAISLAVAAAQKVWAASQWLLNAAMTANPIGLVIAGIVALAAVLVLAWKKSETFRAIVLGTWAAIKLAATAVFGAVKRVVSVVWAFIVKAVTVGSAVIRGAWNVLKTVTGAIWGAIRGIVTAQVRVITGILNALSAVVRTVIGWFKDLAAGIASKVGQAIAIVGRIKDKVVGAISGAARWLVDAGKNVVEGLWEGIQSMGGWIMDKLKEWALSVMPGWLKKVLGIESPARVMVPIGEMVARGVAAGIDKDTSVKQATAQMAKDIQTTAKSALSGLRDQAAEALSFARGIASSIRDFGAVTAFEASDTAPTTTSSVLGDMRSRVEQARRFGRQLSSLKKMGLNNGSLQEIIGAGPDAGGNIAAALLEGGRTAIKQVNRLEKDLARSGARAGSLGADSQLGLTSAQARAVQGAQLRVEKGAITVSLGDGLKGVDRREIERLVQQGLHDALRDLTREIRSK